MVIMEMKVWFDASVPRRAMRLVFSYEGKWYDRSIISSALVLWSSAYYTSKPGLLVEVGNLEELELRWFGKVPLLFEAAS